MRIINWCLNKFHYYVVFSEAALFMFGLIFVHSFVEKAVVRIMITHMIDIWEDEDLAKSAQVVSLQDGTSSVLQVVFASMSDAYLGRFKMVIYSAVGFIIGLFLFWTSELNRHLLPTFYVGMVVIVVSKAAKETSLKVFLDDQLRERDMPSTEEEEERAHSRSNIWWRCASVLGSIAAIVFTYKIKSWELLSMISAIAMLVALLYFFLGFKFYKRIDPTGKPIMEVPFVIRKAITNIKLDYPNTPDELFENHEGVTQISPQVRWLRWLDKAAIKGHEERRVCMIRPRRCPVVLVTEVKLILMMLLICVPFITYSIVKATGETYILEQAYYFETNIPVVLLISLKDLSSFIAEFIGDLVIEKFGNERNELLLMKVRMGFGMITSILCCVTAEDNWVSPRYIKSVLQFILLGTMQGFSEKGLESFFQSQVCESLTRYGEPFTQFVMGIGNFMLALIVFGSWFKADLYSSNLYEYYKLLVILCTLNLFIYVLASFYYTSSHRQEETENQLPVVDLAAEVAQALAET